MADSSRINLREYSRVDALIPIEVRVVPHEERLNIKCFIAGDTMLPDYQVPDDLNDPLLTEWLKMLNAKLDAVIGIIAKQQETSPRFSQKRVNISGGGLSFDSHEEYKINDLLEIKMILPVTLSSTLYVYGEVVDVRKKEDYFQTAVKFVTIDDDIREQIVQFVFKAQRDIIRHKKG
jgi:hypothetical protein